MTGDPKTRGMIPHFWTQEQGHMHSHLSTGLKFFCVQIAPGPKKRENWEVTIYDANADSARIDAEAELAGMSRAEYVDYLAETAVSTAGQFALKHPGFKSKRLKF